MEERRERKREMGADRSNHTLAVILCVKKKNYKFIQVSHKYSVLTCSPKKKNQINILFYPAVQSNSHHIKVYPSCA